MSQWELFVLASTLRDFARMGTGLWVMALLGCAQGTSVPRSPVQATRHVVSANLSHQEPGPSSRAELVFPIALDRPSLFLSHFNRPPSAASFGSWRSGGRIHAGCDLYWTHDDANSYSLAHQPLNENLPVYAVADGEVLSYEPFYQGTNALVVDHGGFVVRYGEVDDRGLPEGVSVGSQVRAGQHIANVGHLAMSNGTWSMLHFELYAGEDTGPLTVRGNLTYDHVPPARYERRHDLLDCVAFLEKIRKASPRTKD